MLSKLRVLSLAVLAVTGSLAATAMAAPAHANDKAFFESVGGTWKGPGEIVAGKYKGTKFVCNLIGDPARSRAAGITLDGTCRVGVFNQKMSATITQKGKSYTGKFLDGAAGEGLDIVSGRVTADRVTMGINRKKLNGAMVARLNDSETLNITISVSVGATLVPVIGMTLKRDAQEVATTGAIR
ncbi:hypothetical protein DFR52_1011122 [Hoeflea marina]|uniref:Uncharacterized protein n=1 Tax=Hoeflea marina TaxID=274592 RepID=A0A317PUR0_9HYPH|nr:hypothetical protein [Hoeflea marina]PWW04424.1 hypothetical protein DFR52_1011122 [Hoeflea marina]